MVAMAGCGGSKATSNAQRERPGPSRVVPQDAFLVVRLNVSRSNLKRSRTVLRRVPIWGLVDDEVRTRNDIAARIARETDLAVEPLARADTWLGDHMGIAVIPRAGTAGTQGEVAWIETRSPRAGWKAVRAAAELDDRTTIDGVDVAHSSELWGAELDGTIVIATSRDALSASIQAHAQTALEDEDSWKTVMHVPSGEQVIATAWVRSRYVPSTFARSSLVPASARRLAMEAARGDIVARVGTSDAGVWAQIDRDVITRPDAVAAQRIASMLDQLAQPIRSMYPKLLSGGYVSICVPGTALRAWPGDGGTVRAAGRCDRGARSERWNLHLDLAAFAKQVGVGIDPRAQALLDGQFSHIAVPQIAERVERRKGGYRVTTRFDARLVE